MLEREIQRLGVNVPPMPELLAELKLSSAEDLHAALGLGRDQRRAGRRRDPAPAAQPRAARPEETLRRARRRRASREAEIQGIGDLLSTYARCCKPVPPEPIVGYITVGRGVSIHSQTCANLARLAVKSPARVLPVTWGPGARTPRRSFPVDIEVQAFDRRGLVRDVSAALADEKISIRAMTTVTDARDHLARMQIGIEIAGPAAAARACSPRGLAAAQCRERAAQER